MASKDSDDDLILVDRILGAPEGDTRAFEALVRRHTRNIVANCRYITRSASDAEDLAQEVFVKAYFALRRFERRSTFRTWLNRIKVNHCLNYVQRAEPRSMVDLEDAAKESPETLRTEPAAERSIASEHERERIGRVLDTLNDTLRIPLLLRDMDELSYQEIADQLGIGLSAVKMRIKRAREEFRRHYRRGPSGSRPAEAEP